MPPTRTHGYLGEVYVVEHAPAARSSGVGVLVLPPLGYEDTCAYRPLRALADALAEAGHRVVRVDWPGLGDSGGDALDTDLHARRLRAVGAAQATLRERGCTRVVGVGVRAGGLLAVEAGGFHGLALWAVPDTGRRYLREEQAFHALAARSFGGVTGPPTPAGAIEAGGFVHGPEVVAALSTVAMASPPAGLARALLIGRDGAAPDPRLSEAWRAAGVDVEERVGEGLGALLENAYHARLAPGVRDAVVAWVSGCGRAGGAGAELGDLAGELVIGGPRVGARERPWQAVGGAGALSGIVCTPADGVRPGLTWTVFYNAGGMRRAGPNRLWTRAARALAATGRPSLRLDVRDVGDSDGREEPATDLEAMYAPASVDDALVAVDWALAQGAAAVDVVGLCSGAYYCAQVSLRRRIRRAVMLNCLAVLWDDEARAWSVTSQVRRSLLDARRWRRLLTGRIDARQLARSLVDEAKLRLRRGLGRPAADPVATLIAEVRRRGTDLVWISSVGDPSLDYLERHVPPAERPPVTLLAGADHTIRPVWLHERVLTLITG